MPLMSHSNNDVEPDGSFSTRPITLSAASVPKAVAAHTMLVSL